MLDDLLLPDVVTAIREMGIAVPERLRVVAAGNKGAITCPHVPADRLLFDAEARARVMADMLARLSRKEPIAQRHVTLPFEVVEYHCLPALKPAQAQGIELTQAVR